jgi:hypothetical protein
MPMFTQLVNLHTNPAMHTGSYDRHIHTDAPRRQVHGGFEVVGIRSEENSNKKTHTNDHARDRVSHKVQPAFGEIERNAQQRDFFAQHPQFRVRPPFGVSLKAVQQTLHSTTEW